MNKLRQISCPHEMRAWAESMRSQNKRIALVPTMGFLHEGHLSLVREALRLGDEVVVSIFVNPTQFGPNEDLDTYPSHLERDLNMLRELGVQAVFTPSTEDMYGSQFNSYVVPDALASTLCGATRPGHFRGVCTVVLLLFRITLCHIAIFGEKDYQQLQVLKQMAQDLWLDVEVRGLPIVRDPDGLAMSSRNARLSSPERQAGLSLHRALDLVETLLAEGVREPLTLQTRAQELIEEAPHTRVDYVQLVHPETLETIDQIGPTLTCALAVFVGKTRLIDNRTYSLES